MQRTTCRTGFLATTTTPKARVFIVVVIVITTDAEFGQERFLLKRAPPLIAALALTVLPLQRANAASTALPRHPTLTQRAPGLPRLGTFRGGADAPCHAPWRTALP